MPTIHQLSRATSYIETYVIPQNGGEPVLRSYATGFFMRLSNALLLITNWHVVTGLDPSNPSMAMPLGPPHFMKASVYSRQGGITELSLPLYSLKKMTPMWDEHPTGGGVDLAIYPLPLAIDEHFDVIDIDTATGGSKINVTIAKDVFILGYPFSKTEMHQSFGKDAHYYLPIWKRGSIASEPNLPFGDNVTLIDSLSKPGMSGAPVVIADDVKILAARSKKNERVIERMNRGDKRAIFELDVDALSETTTKHFNFIGVYSGVIGNTRLHDLALGKCWGMNVLYETITNSVNGKMPYHAPDPFDAYDDFFAETKGGTMVRKNLGGEIIDRVPLNSLDAG